jgi:MFS family permease
VAIPALVPTIERAWGLGEGRLGGLMAVHIAGSMIGGLAGGWLADRRDRKRVVAALLLVASTGYGLAALSLGRVWVLQLGLGLLGLGYGAAFVSGGGLLSVLFPSRRRGSFSILMVTHAAAGIGYPYLVSHLQRLWELGRLSFDVLLGAPLAMVALTLAGLGLLLLRLPLRYPDGPCSPAETAGARGRRGSITGLIVIVVLATLHGSADAILYQWITRFLTVQHPATPFPAAWVLSFYSTAYLVVRLGLSLLPDRIGRRGFLIVPGLIAGPLVLLALRADTFGGTVALYIAATCLYGLEFPALMGYAAQRYPARFSTLFGVVSAFNVTSAGAVWGVGLWIEASGNMVPPLSVSGLGFFAFGLVATAWALWEMPRPAEPSRG